MNETQKTPILIAGFLSCMTVIREEAICLIRDVVTEHKIIGTFYKNRGVPYRHDDEEWEYGSSPIVVTYNLSFGAYGGYEAATVYELFFDERGHLLCTLNGEAGEDFDEPLEHIQTEGLLCIVKWLVEYGFIADDPWLCEECGSLSVQAHVWIDSNTKEIIDPAQDRNEHYCAGCEANTCQIRESEFLRNIDEWWHGQDFRQRECLTGYWQDDFSSVDGYRAFVDACDKWWETLTIEKKIDTWYNNK